MSHLSVVDTTGPDPIFAAIERSRRAELAFNAEEEPPEAVGHEAAESAKALAHTIATTPAGLAALTSYFLEARAHKNCSFFDSIEDAEAFAINLCAVYTLAV